MRHVVDRYLFLRITQDDDMKLIVDENIPYGVEAFGCLGEIVTAHGRAIDNAMLRDADTLIVRSITKVNAALLENTPVRFVGTCTIGEDHIDKAYLAERGIAFSSAPGCNANSVGEYIIAALLTLAEDFDLDLSALTLGIVGVGNVGSKVWQKASALGMTCVLNDPPLAEKTGDSQYRPVDEILDCDIITLHTPLNRGGKHPTRHLVDKEFLRWLKPGAIVINSSRGGVVDGLALEEALRTGALRAAALDVWENEPEPNVELLKLTAIATPHIAGYSFDGKVNGTRQVYEALCAHLGRAAEWDPRPLLPPPPCPELVANPLSPDALTGAVRNVYDIMSDDNALRAIADQAPEERGAYFDRLRKEYPVRREFYNTAIRLEPPDASMARVLSGIGFAMSAPNA